ncbi:MAG: hypothetical protein Q7S64_01955 [bacterium]|nr:hypothetical protein [bacterium]
MAPDDKDQALVSWRAPEFYFYAKNRNWFYSVVGVVALVVVLFLVLKSFDWSFALVIIFGLFVLLQKANHKPETIAINITPQGLVIGEKSYVFEQFKSFHLTDHGDYLSVDFPPKKFGFPVSILVAEENTTRLREVLGKYLPEEPTAKEYLNDRITRWFRF